MDNKIIKMMLLFGGVSSEHEVSRVSAASVLEHINMDKYEIIKVGITKEGKWMHYSLSKEGITAFRNMIGTYTRCDCESDETGAVTCCQRDT